MSFEQSGPVSLGNLLRAGVSLYTREAAALVAEVCRQVFYASELQAPEVEGILLLPDGSVTMSSTSPVVTTEEQMAALASLLEALLPPLGSNEPDYAVRASLRMLAPRARGREGLAPILAPEGLAAELSQFATTDPVAVLRHLWIRADRALHQYLAPIGSEERVVAAVARRSVDAGEVSPSLVDLPLVSSVEGLDEPSARSRNSRPRRLLARVAFSVAAALLFVLGFVGSAWLGKHSYAHAARSATADPRRSSVMPPPRGSVVPPRQGVPADQSPAPLNISDVSGPAFSPSFAQDGRELMFHVGRDPVARIASVRLAPEGRAESVVVLSDDRSRTYHARRSPDGRFVAFDSDREGQRAVFVARRDLSDVTRVSGRGMAALPSWSPNMRWLAIVRAEPNRPRVWNLWLREVQTGVLTRLTNYRFGQTWNASWFPDSKLVCYSHEDELVVIDVTTRAARVFRSPRRGTLVRTPAVSPDGTRIIFQVHQDGVWLLDLTNGSMRRLLTDTSAEEFAWDPTGTRVAYQSHRDGTWRIWLMTAPSV